MKKHFYTLWFRIVLSFFWVLLLTCVLIFGGVYLLYQFHIWNHLQAQFSFLLLLALASVICGTIISLFVVHRSMNPIQTLSNAMQKVAHGDYTITLDSSKQKGELKELYEDFNQMVRELNSTETLHSDFVANVSHEFKTPLATINGYATLLQDDTLSIEERNEYVETIIQSTKELSHMTGNILNLSRLENQSAIYEKEYFRVDEQLRQAILRMEPTWTARNLSIDPELDSITWYGNMELTAHIWNNLLDNAIKFTPPGGEINISAHAVGDALVVIFQDTGIGMSPEVQAHIFDKFYQGDISHKKKGNGLGLSLVRRIVTLYGGFIQLESIPELGSTFTVLLPLTPPDAPTRP
jgi:signal transduction histidine kinase